MVPIGNVRRKQRDPLRCLAPRPRLLLSACTHTGRITGCGREPSFSASSYPAEMTEEQMLKLQAERPSDTMRNSDAKSITKEGWQVDPFPRRTHSRMLG